MTPSSIKGLMSRGVFLSLLAALVIPVATISAAQADTICNDNCVVGGGSISTPLGPVSVSVTSANVVTVTLTPTVANVVVFGIPVAIPPGPPAIPGYARTTIATAGGAINIDTIIPPVPPGRFALPDIAVISIHPPSPCRAHTSDNTVTFTPIVPPGPPA